MSQGTEPSREVFRFGEKALIAFLAFLNAFVPLSIDLYLPALPTMARFFSSSDGVAKLTLSLFMLFFAISMLFWGPFSDRYGRKPVLRTGLALYIVASLGCAASTSMGALIAGRVVQAIACGAVSSVSMAIVKDVFRGRIMENVLVAIQTMTVLCPLLAPVLGAFLLLFVSWRGLFVILLGFGVLALLLSFALRESSRETLAGSALHSLTRIGFVLRCRGFRTLALIFSLISMPFMAYLSSSAFIYEDGFGTSSQEFSLYFSANALFSVLGPILYVRFLRELPRTLFITAVFALVGFGGLAVAFFGGAGPMSFAPLFMLVSFACSSIRPAGTVLTMTQLDSDNGTMASLMSSGALFCGSIAMLVCSLEWANLVHVVGLISAGSGFACLALWTAAVKGRKFKENTE
ncbi:MFS transporter [Desulfovibrio sp. OttesenSCG-928-G15]|nr:MFS transporter [Desulfovibrio sp. OttesenSCG-928-G15]